MIASGSLIFFPSRKISDYYPLNEIVKDSLNWQERGIQWLIKSQSPDGGWGTGSHATESKQRVQTDPGTTALVAKALLKAGGELNRNPYKKEILNALHLILDHLEKSSSSNVVSFSSLRLPNIPSLSTNIVISEFILEINDQLSDTLFSIDKDQSGNLSLTLPAKPKPLEAINPITLESAIANNYNVRDHRDSVMQLPSSVGGNVNGIRVQSINNDEMDGVLLSEAIVVELRAPLVEHDNTTSGGYVTNISRSESRTSYSVHGINRSANNTATIQISGEEYVGYKKTSESLVSINHEKWLKWRKDMEKQFKASQNPNGSWTGYHCFSSPAICTASVLLAWYAGE